MVSYVVTDAAIPPQLTTTAILSKHWLTMQTAPASMYIFKLADYRHYVL